MECKLTTLLGIFTLLLCVVFGDETLKTLEGKTTAKAKTCYCQISTESGKVLHDFGGVATYDTTSMSCHEMRVKCRKDCDAAIQKTTTQHSDPTSPLRGYYNGRVFGHQLCRVWDKTTDNNGIKLVSKSEVDEATCVNHDKSRYGHWSTQLCCGHHEVRICDQVFVAFVWKPMCDESMAQL